MSWPIVKLHDICRPRQRKTIAASSLLDSGYSVYGANGKIGYYSEFTHEFPTLMITCRGATCGNVHISEPRSYINGNAMAIDDIDPLIVDLKYLYYFFLKRGFEDVISGSAQPQITGQGLTKVEIPLPPLEEQKRIAAILDKADAIRQKRQQAIELADEFLRSVFLDMFGDPVTNLKGWEVESLSSLIHVQGGYAFKSADFGTEGIPVVKIGNANKKGFTAESIDFVQPTHPEKLKQYELFSGDLLMSLTGTVGKDDYGNITEVTEEYNKYYLNQRVAKISIKSKKINKEYLKYCLSHQAMKNELIKNNRGVRQANISNSDIYQLVVPVPELNDQDFFCDIVKNIEKQKNRLEGFYVESNELFASLSAELFS